jgi:multidrug efflux pump subunit AcrA (membrane-fusion protein)
MSLGRRRVWWLAAGAVVVVVAVIVGFVAFGGNDKAKQGPVPTSKVARGTVATTVSAAGTVQSQASRTLGFTSSGALTEVDVKPGDVVLPGKVLAKIDPTSAQKAVDSAQDAVSSAADQVENAQNELNNAAKTSGSGTTTCPVSLVRGNPNPSPSASPTPTHSPTPTPSATGTQGGNPGTGNTQGGGKTQGGSGTQCGSSSGSSGSGSGGGNSRTGSSGGGTDSLMTAQQRLNDAQLTLKQANAKLDGTVITAPIGGKILSVGGAVGSNAGSNFIVLAGSDDIVVKAQFTEAEIAHLAVKQPAKITLPDQTGTNYTGSVIQIDPAGTISSRLVRYAALISFDKVPTDVLYGQSANVAVTTSSVDNVLCVPSTAIANRKGDSGTVTVQIGGRTERRTVTLGLRGDVNTEVKNGLTEGETVLTTAVT